MALFAIYSNKQAARYGSIIYTDTNGKEIEVTSVGSVKGCPLVEWPDKIDMGEVVKFVRQGRPDHILA